MRWWHDETSRRSKRLTYKWIILSAALCLHWELRSLSAATLLIPEHLNIFHSLTSGLTSSRFHLCCQLEHLHQPIAVTRNDVDIVQFNRILRRRLLFIPVFERLCCKVGDCERKRIEVTKRLYYDDDGEVGWNAQYRKIVHTIESRIWLRPKGRMVTIALKSEEQYNLMQSMYSTTLFICSLVLSF